MNVYSQVKTEGFMNLMIGDEGYQVRELQSLLSLKVDGNFGPKTDAAVRAYQREIDLVADGIAGPKVMHALRGGRTSNLLHHSDIERAAEDLGIPVASVLAVNEVESRGAGFLPSGDPVILFERHIMRRMLKKGGVDTAALEASQPSLVNRKRGGYKGGQREHIRLTQAKEIDPEAAVQSASWGLFQIMGFHYNLLGYATTEAWEAAMRKSEGKHLEAFVSFIIEDRQLHEALKDKNWAKFAEGYNGPAYKENQYDVKMARAYVRHAKANVS